MSTDKYPVTATSSSVPGMSDVFSFRSIDGAAKAFLTGNMIGRLRKELSHLLSARVRTSARSVQHAHHEAAFRLLLANEVKRSARSGRSFHILLTYFPGPEGNATRMGGKVTRTLLPILSGVLRETDYIGWYRDDHVLGGVLTTLGDHSATEVSCRIEQRFWQRIERDFPSREFDRLKVRFFPAQEFERIESTDSLFMLG